MSRILGERQKEIIDFIYTHIKEKKYPPTVREIGNKVGLASSSTVHGHLRRLEKYNYITKDPTKPRAIQLLKHYKEDINVGLNDELNGYQKIPIIGKVTAGLPITAFENIEGYMPAPLAKTQDDNWFSLRIVGESMIKAGIHNGDLVIVNQQQTANNGDIVVAMTEDNEATVKRFFKESNHIRLQPENDDMDPILLNNVTILGKVMGSYRSYN
ncbi:transcriptional repressor LexA [Priestia filamentosa]|uniref:transcriptional repressor LexA n=1 Tax=Priestia filamentosa TaxID=1402861 RepID=UPI00058969A8